MSIARHTHVQGIENVLQFYENMNIPALAIFTGNQFCWKLITNDIDEGKEALQKWADLLGDSNYAHHTIRVYENPKEIKAKTDYDGSFNFQLNEDPNKVGHVLGSTNNLVLSKLNAIETRMKKIEEGGGEEGDDNVEDYGLGKLGRIIQHPAIAPLVLALGGKISESVMGFIGGNPVEVNGLPAPQKDTAGDEKQLQDAITRLKKTTPNLHVVLQKLAKLSESSPGLYKTYLGMFLRLP